MKIPSPSRGRQGGSEPEQLTERQEHLDFGPCRRVALQAAAASALGTPVAESEGVNDKGRVAHYCGMGITRDSMRLAIHYHR